MPHWNRPLPTGRATPTQNKAQPPTTKPRPHSTPAKVSSCSSLHASIKQTVCHTGNAVAPTTNNIQLSHRLRLVQVVVSSDRGRMEVAFRQRPGHNIGRTANIIALTQSPCLYGTFFLSGGASTNCAPFPRPICYTITSHQSYQHRHNG